MKVNEIFYSIQGEGYYTGTPSIFIRLSGCNLHCGFCDTMHQPYKELTKEEIMQEVAKYQSKRIVFTGGEPSLKLNQEIVHYFKTKGYSIQVETNGTRNMPFEGIDWVTCSPKCGYCKNANVKQETIDEVKVVYDGKTDPSKFLALVAKYYYLQPCDVGNAEQNEKITRQCIEYILAHPQWRLSLQTQKILKVR